MFESRQVTGAVAGVTPALVLLDTLHELGAQLLAGWTPSVDAGRHPSITAHQVPRPHGSGMVLAMIWPNGSFELFAPLCDSPTVADTLGALRTYVEGRGR